MANIMDTMIKGQMAMIRIGLRVAIKIFLPKKINFNKLWNRMSINDRVSEIEHDYALKKEEVLNQLCDLVFNYADTDKNGTLSEDECKFFLFFYFYFFNIIF